MYIKLLIFIAISVRMNNFIFSVKKLSEAGGTELRFWGWCGGSFGWTPILASARHFCLIGVA
jgi:hypothetical protein